MSLPTAVQLDAAIHAVDGETNGHFENLEQSVVTSPGNAGVAARPIYLPGGPVSGHHGHRVVSDLRQILRLAASPSITSTREIVACGDGKWKLVMKSEANGNSTTWMRAALHYTIWPTPSRNGTTRMAAQWET